MKNQRNKLDISKSSTFQQEGEILLLPYFCFIVKKNGPSIIGGKNVCLVEIEELGEKENLDINSRFQNSIFEIVWFDSKFFSFENQIYCGFLQEKFRIEIKGFTDLSALKDYMSQSKLLTYLITSGKGGQNVLDSIDKYENIIKTIVFCGDAKHHRSWATKEKYKKLMGVYDDFTILVKELLNPFY